MTQERIAKRIARSGVCSRREAERLIEEGKVKVDGKTITSPALNVDENNIIQVNGKPLADAEPTRLWLYHKPVGLLTTHKDPENRPTIFSALPSTMPRVISIGRLDINSEGLLLLTNDGALARHLELPATGWIRRYRLRIYGVLTEAHIKQIEKGVTVDGVNYGPMTVKIDSQAGRNCWVTVGLKEGKNRELRNVFNHFDLQVSRLLRIAYGPFQLGQIPRREVKEVPKTALKNALGKTFEIK